MILDKTHFLLELEISWVLWRKAQLLHAVVRALYICFWKWGIGPLRIIWNHLRQQKWGHSPISSRLAKGMGMGLMNGRDPILPWFACCFGHVLQLNAHALTWFLNTQQPTHLSPSTPLSPFLIKPTWIIPSPLQIQCILCDLGPLMSSFQLNQTWDWALGELKTVLLEHLDCMVVDPMLPLRGTQIEFIMKYGVWLGTCQCL